MSTHLTLLSNLIWIPLFQDFYFEHAWNFQTWYSNTLRFSHYKSINICWEELRRFCLMFKCLNECLLGEIEERPFCILGGEQKLEHPSNQWQALHCCGVLYDPIHHHHHQHQPLLVFKKLMRWSLFIFIIVLDLRLLISASWCLPKCLRLSELATGWCTYIHLCLFYLFVSWLSGSFLFVCCLLFFCLFPSSSHLCQLVFAKVSSNEWAGDWPVHPDR